MRILEFECAPSIVAFFESLQGRAGRFLLEDVGGRTAILGSDPRAVLTAKDGATTLARGNQVERRSGDPFELLRDELARFGSDEPPPQVPFAGGAVGFFSYDLGRSVESVPLLAREDVPTPDLCLGFYDSALCIDLDRRLCTAVSWSGDRDALAFWRDLALNCCRAEVAESAEAVHCPGSPDELGSNFTRPEYLDAVSRIRDYIAAGDVYQVNLSQRFEAELRASPWALYRALRRINPAPKSCYMEMGGLVLASASPEILLTCDPATRLAVTRPIKGTRPRGRTPQEDVRLASELAASEKDRAENVMIVDMERNDLGRVARYGSVRVTNLWDIETHPNVFQMVSTVEAELAEGCGPVDLLRACFPGGSITGAPKVRAMEIIEELEPHRRGVYTGSAGFIDFAGRMDLNILIRSFVIHGSRVYFHAGGGIVIDSDPAAEYQETLDKISGLRAALRGSEASE